jgi:Tripartite tricarboxylate transporter family receptor
VTYRGGALAMQDLVAGQIDMMIDVAANALPQVSAGIQGLRRRRQTPDGRGADDPDGGRGGDAGHAFRSGLPFGRPRTLRRELFASSMRPSPMHVLI